MSKEDSYIIPLENGKCREMVIALASFLG